jgi:DNA repair and recombination protein RAD52
MFNDEQKAALSADLSRSVVKTRKGGGMTLSYIEGWWAIAEANRIFGFDGWTRETVDMLKCGNPEHVVVYEWDNNTRKYEAAVDKKTGETAMQWRVRFMSKVRITVGDIIREGTGYGSGIAGDLGDAYEGAIKEAETDAMKRALMTFGNPFGLALYDKGQSSVSNAPAGKPLAVQVDERDRLDWMDVLGDRPLDVPVKNASQSRTPFIELKKEMAEHTTPSELALWAESRQSVIWSLANEARHHLREAYDTLIEKGE